MSSRHLSTALYEKLKAALFIAYGEAEGNPLKLRAAHAAIDKQVQLFEPLGEPSLALERKPPAERKPSLARAIKNAVKAGGKVKEASVRPDGTIVLQFEHNLDDSHVPTIRSDNEWDEVLKQ
jgi:hypothetical protein